MARKKFKFVEMFLDPTTGAPFEDTGSPMMIKTEHFGTFLGHQIARIEYEEKEVEDVEYKVGEGGKVTKGPVRKRIILIEKMGEKGGWIEQMGNLAQDGNCWVGPDSKVCGNGLLLEDATISGAEIGDNARVRGKASVEGSKNKPIGIGGYADVYGKAQVTGQKRIAISGTARVEGKVNDKATVTGNTYVGPKATINGKAVVSGNAKVIEGLVTGDAVVSGNSVVYGKVMDAAKVQGEAILLKSGMMKDESKVFSGVVGGQMKDQANIPYGQCITEEGSSIGGKTVVSGNAYIGKGVSVTKESAITGNGYVMEGGSVENGKVLQNATVGGSLVKGSVTDTALAKGDIKDGTASGGCRVIGSVTKAGISGSANIGGSTAKYGFSGNAVLCEGVGAEMGAGGNQVYYNNEDKRDSSPGVICGVKPSSD